MRLTHAAQPQLQQLATPNWASLDPKAFHTLTIKLNAELVSTLFPTHACTLPQTGLPGNNSSIIKL